jgi:hypothetical protein
MIEDDESRLEFFDEDDFAEWVNVAPDEGEAFSRIVIFDAKPVNTGSFENRFPDKQGARPSGSSPCFQARDIDFPKALAGRATVTIRDRPHSIFDIQHDGTGMAYVTVKLK